jgi:hypothetical protein
MGLSEDQARKAIEIINEECRANIGDDERAFIKYVTKGNSGIEWRFMGALGFGGKFRVNYYNKPHPYVDCYTEHMNDERRAMIDKANARLSELKIDPS